jgi:type I restriction enzyme S subunit
MTQGWPIVELQEVMSALYDGPHATPKESHNGAIFLGIKNVTEDGRLDLENIRYIAEDDMPRWTKRVIPAKDDIVFSYEATLHRYARIPEGFRGCLGRRMALIRVNKKVCDVEFLFSYFLSPLWRCEVERHILTGATVDRIPLTHVPKFKVHLPPLPAQKKIAKILSAYDRLIENNLKRIKLLEEMAQITYEEWFVRLRFPGHESTPINPKTGLPEGWRMGNMQDLFDFKNGYAFKSGTYVQDGQHKIVTIKNVQDGSFIPDTTDTIAELPRVIPPENG